MSQQSNHNYMLLFIGRPVLNAQWEGRHFLTRDIGWQEHLRNAHYTVHTYPVAPFFDVQAARQLLLTSTNYTELVLCVSFLELDHRSCATIVEGITTLLVNQSDQVDSRISLEYEFGNAEHQEAVQLIEDLIPLRLLFDNFQIEALSRMTVEGDTGHGEL